MGTLALTDPVLVFQGANPGDGVSVSSTNTYRSKRLDCLGGSRASFQLIWTGTPTGTFTVWSTNDKAAGTADDTNWVQETVTIPANPAGSASNTMVHLYENSARWIRVRYVNASGTGTLRALAMCKE